MKKILLYITMLLLLSSCRSTRAVAVPMPEQHSRDSLRALSHFAWDSLYIDRWHFLVQRGDTIYRTDSVYVEKKHGQASADTVRIVIRDTVPVIVEVPVEVEKPIPRGQRLIRDTTYRFLVRCTIGLFALIVFAIIAFVARFYLRR